MRMTTPASAVSALLLPCSLLLAPEPGGGQEAAAPDSAADEPSWPVEVVLGDYLVVIYQPQPESFEGNLLEGRFVLSAEETGGAGDPLFGTAWFEARVGNGSISHSGLPFTSVTSGPGTLRGTLGSGVGLIDLMVGNGWVEVRGE